MTITELVRAIIENNLGLIHEKDSSWFIQCPGSTEHTNHDGHKDCSVYVHAESGRFPHVVLHCVHASCEDSVRQAQKAINEKIEDALRHGGYEIRPLTEEEKQARKQAILLADKKKQLQLTAEKLLPGIIKEYALTVDELKSSSPVTMPTEPQDAWRMFLQQLFTLEDCLWMGHEIDSGSQVHAANFKTVESWLKNQCQAPSPFTTPSTFHPGCFCRTKENVMTGKYLVFESDVLDLHAQLAVGRYLQEKLKLDLRAAVFSGGKSIHFWFRMSGVNTLEQISPLLVGLGADRKVLRLTQPVRLPGYFRAEKSRWQELLWLSDKTAHDI